MEGEGVIYNERREEVVGGDIVSFDENCGYA